MFGRCFCLDGCCWKVLKFNKVLGSRREVIPLYPSFKSDSNSLGSGLSIPAVNKSQGLVISVPPGKLKISIVGFFVQGEALAFEVFVTLGGTSVLFCHLCR